MFTTCTPLHSSELLPNVEPRRLAFGKFPYRMARRAEGHQGPASGPEQVERLVKKNDSRSEPLPTDDL